MKTAISLHISEVYFVTCYIPSYFHGWWVIFEIFRKFWGFNYKISKDGTTLKAQRPAFLCKKRIKLLKSNHYITACGMVHVNSLALCGPFYKNSKYWFLSWENLRSCCYSQQFLLECLRATSVITLQHLSLIHISEPTRPLYISYAVFCLKKLQRR